MSCTRKAFPVTSPFSSKGSQQWVRLGLQALAGRGKAQHRPLETRMVLLPREDGGLGGPMKATLYTALHFLSPALSVRTTFIGKENTDSIFKEVKQFVPGPPVQAYSTTAHHHVGESNRTTGKKAPSLNRQGLDFLVFWQGLSPVFPRAYALRVLLNTTPLFCN